MATDWLVGRDRQDAAAERIYTAAAELIARRGYENFTIEELAKRVHCSPATVYRHVGGKVAIRDAVTMRLAARVVASAREAIEGLSGAERVVTATVVALREVRAERLGRMMMEGPHDLRDRQWITASDLVTELAYGMIGTQDPDPVAAQWLIRVMLMMWQWPMSDVEAEREMLHRFLGPPFDAE